MKLVYSEPSIRDLRRLRNFIARHNPDVAQRVARELLERLENIAMFPRMGVAVRDAPISESLRDIILDDYIIRYSYHPELVVVLRIWHRLEDRQ